MYSDLKPENIMLDQYGHVRITDFGLVYELKMHENQVIWPQGESGTPNYMCMRLIITLTL
jgi:protein-serine/threonine kinase